MPTSAPSRIARSTRSQLSPALEPRRKRPRRRRLASTDCANSTVSKPSSRTSAGEHVDARLRQRRLEPRVVGDERRCRPPASRERADARAGDDAGRLAVELPRAWARTPSDAFVSAPSWCSRKTRSFTAAASRRGSRRSPRRSSAPPSMRRLSPRGGGGWSAEHGRRARAGAADVGRGEHLLRLRLRAHDPLERRVARLVDRVRHGDDRGQRRAQRLVAELGLAPRR